MTKSMRYAPENQTVVPAASAGGVRRCNQVLRSNICQKRSFARFFRPLRAAICKGEIWKDF